MAANPLKRTESKLLSPGLSVKPLCKPKTSSAMDTDYVHIDRKSASGATPRLSGLSLSTDDKSNGRATGIPSPSSLLPTSGDKPIPPSIKQLTDDELFELYKGRTGGFGSGVGKFKQLSQAVGNFQPVPIIQTTTVVELSAIPLGTSGAINTRIGPTVGLHSLKMRYEMDSRLFQLQPGATTGAIVVPNVRILICRDKMSMATPPIMSVDTKVDVTVDNSSILNTYGSGNGFNTLAGYNQNTFGTRFDILHDRVWTPHFQYQIGDAANHWISTDQTFDECHIDLKGIKVNFANANGNSAVDNSIFMMVCTDNYGATNTIVNNFFCIYTLYFNDAQS